MTEDSLKKKTQEVNRQPPSAPLPIPTMKPKVNIKEHTIPKTKQAKLQIHGPEDRRTPIFDPWPRRSVRRSDRKQEGTTSSKVKGGSTIFRLRKKKSSPSIFQLLGQRNEEPLSLFSFSDLPPTNTHLLNP